MVEPCQLESEIKRFANISSAHRKNRDTLGACAVVLSFIERLSFFKDQVLAGQ